MQVQLNDILVSGDQNHWGNVISGVKVVQINEQGIKVRRVMHIYNGEEFFLTHQALNDSLWQPLECGRQLPLL